MNDVLEDRVREAGLACRVEARERLALLVPEGNPGVPLTAAARLSILQIARAEGFTHVAVELDPDVASLPGD